jgi:hypothetical protein
LRRIVPCTNPTDEANSGDAYSRHNKSATIRSDGTFDPQGFNVREEVADVPEIQKLFTVRDRDINLLIAIHHGAPGLSIRLL